MADSWHDGSDGSNIVKDMCGVHCAPLPTAFGPMQLFVGGLISMYLQQANISARIPVTGQHFSVRLLQKQRLVTRPVMGLYL